jgi:hypothetical protein
MRFELRRIQHADADDFVAAIPTELDGLKFPRVHTESSQDSDRPDEQQLLG